MRSWGSNAHSGGSSGLGWGWRWEEKGSGAGSLISPHTCQNSAQTTRSLNVNWPFQIASKVSLSRQETFILQFVGLIYNLNI